MKPTTIAILTFFAASFVFGGNNDKYVVANGSYLALYKNKDRDPNEPAKLRVPKTELLKVVTTRGSHILVQTSKGEKGWAEKWLVTPFKTSTELFSNQKLSKVQTSSPIVCITTESVNTNKNGVIEASLKGEPKDTLKK